MLVVTRKENEGLVIQCPDGTEIAVRVGRLTGDRVRLAIRAPLDYKIQRDEIREPQQESRKDR